MNNKALNDLNKIEANHWKQKPTQELCCWSRPWLWDKPKQEHYWQTNKLTKYKKTIARCSVLQTLESTKRNFLIRSIVCVYLDLDKHFLQIWNGCNEDSYPCLGKWKTIGVLKGNCVTGHLYRANVAVIVLLAIFEFPFTPTQVKPSSHFVTGNMYLRIFLHTNVKVGVKSLRYLLS